VTRTPRRFAALVAFLATAPLAARAAEAVGVLAVAEPPGPEAGLARLTGELRDALAARSGGVLDAAALRERMAGRAAGAALAELDRAFAGAVAAHADGDFEGSHRTLRAVVEALEAQPDGPEVFAAWRRAMLRLARSEQELGRGIETQAVLERLLRAAPETKADPRQFPPSFQRLVEEGRARLEALGTVALTVEAQPPARVFVEGREVGVSPVTVALAPGRYRVAGLSGGLATAAVVVELTGPRTVQLDMSMAEALRPEAGPGLALPVEGRAARLVTVASRLSLDRVVAVALRQEGEETRLTATRYDARRGVAEREGWIVLAAGAPPPQGLAALAAWLADGRGSPLVATPLGPSLSLAPAPPARPIGELPPAPAVAARPKALGWVAVGAGVASLVAGGLAVSRGLDAQARYDDARRMLGAGGRVAAPYTVAEYNETILAGDRRRESATALAIGAGVGAAATAVLGWLGWRAGDEPGTVRF